MALPALDPMLATAARQLGPGQWAVEPELDGWRALVYVDSTVTVRTRHGRNVTRSLPELAPLGDHLAGRSVILDGELVTGQGLPGDFYRLGPPLASTPARARQPVAFVAFDVLHLDGRSLLPTPYSERRELLDGLGLCDPAWCTAPSFTGELVDVLTAAVGLGLEGVVVKRLDGRYEPGSARVVAQRAVHLPRH